MNTFMWGFKAVMGAATAGISILLGIIIVAAVIYFVLLRDR